MEVFIHENIVAGIKAVLVSNKYLRDFGLLLASLVMVQVLLDTACQMFIMAKLVACIGWFNFKCDFIK